MKQRESACGFTLVELLVVIAVIGILIALIMPAVQAAREASRRAQCINNLKQIGLACLNCESAVAHMPAGGWAVIFLGDPERGSGYRQTGGPIFNILPYLEQQPLYDMLSHKTTGSTPTQVEAAIAMISTPLPVLNCPSRRKLQTFIQQPTGTIDHGGSEIWAFQLLGHYGVVDNLTQSAHSDYCGNGFDYLGLEEVISTTGRYPNPELVALIGSDYSTVRGGPSGPTSSGGGSAAADALIFSSDQKTRMLFSAINATLAGKGGIFYPHSTLRVGQISDGTSSTYLFGEKYVNPDDYLNGMTHGDCFTCYSGYSTDSVHYTRGRSPVRDTHGYNPDVPWGGPHVGGFNMAFCDGSVHSVSFAISLTVHNELGNRADGSLIDPASLTSN